MTLRQLISNQGGFQKLPAVQKHVHNQDFIFSSSINNHDDQFSEVYDS